MSHYMHTQAILRHVIDFQQEFRIDKRLKPTKISIHTHSRKYCSSRWVIQIVYGLVALVASYMLRYTHSTQIPMRFSMQNSAPHLSLRVNTQSETVNYWSANDTLSLRFKGTFRHEFVTSNVKQPCGLKALPRFGVPAARVALKLQLQFELEFPHIACMHGVEGR